MASDRPQPSAFAQPCQIRWAKVPGWQWWPAVVVPETEEQRQQQLRQQEEQGNGNRALPNLVCFLVDNTMARCPQLPFDAHYHRFLNVAYSDKRLMQAVEEGRALLLDSSLWQPVSARQLALQQAAGVVPEPGPDSTQQQRQQQQPVLLPYPAPLPDDAAKRSSKQLLKWLQTAALAPEGPYNGIKDQQTRRVLHAVRSSRHVDCQLPEVVTKAETAAAAAEAPTPGPPARPQPVPPSAAAPSRAPAAAAAADAAAAEEFRPSKRQRKPTGLLLQSSTRLPSLLNSGGPGPAAPAGVKRGLWGPAGSRPGAAGGVQRPGPHQQQQQQQQQGLRPPLAQRSSSSNQLAVGGCKRAPAEAPKPFPGRASRFQLLRRSSGGGGSGSGGGGLSSAASRSSSSSGEHGGRRQGTCSPPPKRSCHQGTPAARVRAVTPELLCTPEPDSSSEGDEGEQQRRLQPWEEQAERAAAAAGGQQQADMQEEEEEQQQRQGPRDEPMENEEEPSTEEEEEEEDDDDEILLLPRSGLLRPSTSRATAPGVAAAAAAAAVAVEGAAAPPAGQQATAAAAAAVAAPTSAAGGDAKPAPAAPAAAAALAAPDGAVVSSSPPTPEAAAGGKSPGGWYHPITRLRRLSTPEEEPQEAAGQQAWSSSDYEQEEEDDDEETETDEPEPEPPLAVTRGRRALAGTKKKQAGTKRTRQQLLQQQLRSTSVPPLPRTAASAAGAGGGHARGRQQARRAAPRVTPTLTSATITSASTSHTATATPTSQGGGGAGPGGGSSSICQPQGPLRPPAGFYPAAAMAAFLGSCRGVSTAAGASPSDLECVRSDTVGARFEDEARRLLLPVDCGRRGSLFDPAGRLPPAGTSSPRFAGYVPERCRAVKTKRSGQQQQQQQQQQGQAQQAAGHRAPSVGGVPQPQSMAALLHAHRHPHHLPPHGFAPQALMLPGSSPPLGPWAMDVMVPAWDLLQAPPGAPWSPSAAAAAAAAAAPAPAGGAGLHASSPVGSPGASTAAPAAAAAAAAMEGLDEGATLGRTGSTMGGLDCMGLVEDAPLCSMDDLFQLPDQDPMTPEDLEAALSGQAAAASSREGSLAPDSGAGAAGRQPLVGGALGSGGLSGRGHPKQAGAPGGAHRRSSSGSGSEHDTLDMPWEWEVHKDTPADPELQADLEAAAAHEAAAAQRNLLRLKRLPSTGGGASDPDLSTPHFPPRHPRLRTGCDPTSQAPGRCVVGEAGVGSVGAGGASSSSAATVLREALVGLVPGGDALQYLAEQLLSCREELAACRAARTHAEQSHHTAATQLSAAQASLKAAQVEQEEAQKLLAAKGALLAEAQQRTAALEKDLQQLQAKLSQQAPRTPAAGAGATAAAGTSAPAPAQPPPSKQQQQQQQWVHGQLKARELELAAARMECERLRHVVAQGQQTGAVMAGHILSGVLASPGLTPAEKDKLRAEMQGMLVQVCMGAPQVAAGAPRAPPAPTAEVK